MSLAVESLAEIVGGQAAGFAEGAVVTGFATDNREVKPGDLFLAIKGERVDGHDFAASAVAAGAVGVLAEKSVAVPHLLVPNLVEALAKLGSHFRSTFTGPVIGITGSAGKTSTKEFTAAALSPLGPVLKTTGNRNTEYTSPLVWAELAGTGETESRRAGETEDAAQQGLPSDSEAVESDGRVADLGTSSGVGQGAPSPRGEGEGAALVALPEDAKAVSAAFEPVEFKAAVIEMAMRGFGQIAHLAKISRPTVAIVTNIGFSHLEQVKTREGIADAKGELLDSLPSDATAILWKEDPYFERLKGKCRGRVLTFGTTEGSDCRIDAYNSLSWSEGWMRGVCMGSPFEAHMPTVGRHQALNAAAAILAAVVAGVDLQQAAASIKSAELPPMRMQTLNLNGASILLDTYNASPPAMISAIETFKELPCMGRRFAVMGEMKELGNQTIESHREVGRALVKANLYKILFYGMPMTFARQELLKAGAPGKHLPFATSIKDVQEFLQIELQPGDAVLIKGSRALELERALEPLQVGA